MNTRLIRAMEHWRVNTDLRAGGPDRAHCKGRLPGWRNPLALIAGPQTSLLIPVIRRRKLARIPPIRTRQPPGRCRAVPWA
jgi:hypothetical protein